MFASTFFAIFFSMMFQEATADLTEVLYIKYRTDGGIFNLCCRLAKTKCRVKLQKRNVIWRKQRQIIKANIMRRTERNHSLITLLLHGLKSGAQRPSFNKSVELETVGVWNWSWLLTRNSAWWAVAAQETLTNIREAAGEAADFLSPETMYRRRVMPAKVCCANANSVAW